MEMPGGGGGDMAKLCYKDFLFLLLLVNSMNRRQVNIYCNFVYYEFVLNYLTNNCASCCVTFLSDGGLK